MKKLSLLLGGVFAFSLCFAQQSDPSIPYSWQRTDLKEQVPVMHFAKPDVEQLLREDDQDMSEGKAFRVGVTLSASLDLQNSGLWELLPDGSALWRIKLEAADAYALSLTYTSFRLPEGASVYIYNEGRNHVIGPYTTADNPDGDLYATPIVNGSYITIEYNQPAGVSGDVELIISNLVYYYKKQAVFNTQTKDFGDSGSCEVNVNCSEGNNWQDEKRGVARILFKEGANYYFCSGSMMNNTAQDCTPYFLTAQHCGTAASHADMRQWIFYFNYEASGCSDPGSEGTLASKTVTGCVKLAASGTISDVQKSDFLLVLLKNRPSATFNAYLNGWNRNNTASGSGVGIHHPAGDIKKISTYTSSLSSTTWDGTSGSHWRVIWDNTSNGHGVTEEGSSGSPLFNNSGLVVGDLSGGSSFCNSPNSPDSYGKFYYSWDQCGTTNDKRLKPWLDRTSAGSATLTGKENTCTAASLPTIEFSADNVWPAINQTVTLTDATTGGPFYWQWQMTPTTYTYVNGTNMYSQNPQVQFTATGTYTVTLYAGNIAGYNYKNKTSYIHVGNVGVEEEQINPVSIYPNPSAGTFLVNVENSDWNLQQLVVTISDIQGKTLYMQNQPSLMGSLLQVTLPGDMSDGLYFITLSDQQHPSVTRRIQLVR